MRFLLTVAAAVALAGCGGGDAAPPAPAPSEAAPARADLAGTTLDGEPISLAEFRGKPLLVNVWSSW